MDKRARVQCKRCGQGDCYAVLAIRQRFNLLDDADEMPDEPQEPADG